MATNGYDPFYEGIMAMPGGTLQASHDEFRKGHVRDRVMAEVQHTELGQHHDKTDYKSVEGLGQLRCRIPVQDYHHYGQMYGYDCWNDQAFLDTYEESNPGGKVNSGGTKLQFGYVPSDKSKVKYHKNFG